MHHTEWLQATGDLMNPQKIAHSNSLRSMRAFWGLFRTYLFTPPLLPSPVPGASRVPLSISGGLDNCDLRNESVPALLLPIFD